MVTYMTTHCQSASKRIVANLYLKYMSKKYCFNLICFKQDIANREQHLFHLFFLIQDTYLSHFLSDNYIWLNVMTHSYDQLETKIH